MSPVSYLERENGAEGVEVGVGADKVDGGEMQLGP